MNTFTKISKKLSVLILGLIIATAAVAQDEEGGFSFSGTVDTYYKATPGFGDSAPNSSFTFGSGFSMGMVNLVTSYEGEKVGFVGDLVFGPRGLEAAFGDNWSGQNIVNQMFAYWNVSDGLTLTLGQWNTFLGYEVISPAANFNYSCSYMFSWGPFNQSGLKADIALSDSWSLMLAVMNPTDVLEKNFTDANGDFKYTGGVQLGYSGDAASVYLNSRFGDASGKLFQVDLTAGFDLSDAFFLGVNGTVLDDDGAGFMGVALYPQIAISDNATIGARGEYFAVNGDYAGILVTDTNGDGSVIDLTFSANINVTDNLLLIPEVRFDMTSEDTFVKTDGSTTSSTLPMLLFAAVYAF
ncbi:MAG: outer membrane beta-barrel protein [Bacteroidota bacterium]